MPENKVFVRAVFGPFGSQRNDLTGTYKWFFNVITEPGESVHYVVMFNTKERSYNTNFISQGASSAKIGRASKSLPENSDMFVPDKPMEYGPTLTNILLRHIPETEKADCIAMSLAKVGA